MPRPRTVDDDTVLDAVTRIVERAEMFESIEKLLSKAVAAGELVPTDTRRLAAAVQSTYNGALITWAMRGEGPVADWLQSQVTFLLNSFRLR
jgi:hypothetical protein